MRKPRPGHSAHDRPSCPLDHPRSVLQSIRRSPDTGVVPDTVPVTRWTLPAMPSGLIGGDAPRGTGDGDERTSARRHASRSAERRAATPRRVLQRRRDGSALARHADARGRPRRHDDRAPRRGLDPGGDARGRGRRPHPPDGGTVRRLRREHLAPSRERRSRRSATLELRIPSAQFDGVVARAQPAREGGDGDGERRGRVRGVRRPRCAAGERTTVEARLVEMLATRTGKLSDVLTVEQELARVRQEAERYEARIRWLEHRASLSSLDGVVAREDPVDRAAARPRADRRGVRRGLDAVRGLHRVVHRVARNADSGWRCARSLARWCARRLLGGGTPPGVSQA